MQNLRLGILDLSPRRENGSDIEAIQETLEVARAADRLGFHRFWISEHHNHHSLSNSSPELLICRIAGITQRIRVGSGGIMLSNYSPLKVAEWIRTLEVLFPGRIDIGLGRASGADHVTTSLLNPGYSLSGQKFENDLGLLKVFLAEKAPVYKEEQGVVAHPIVPFNQNIWILSSSGQSTAVAAKFGYPISFAHFMNPDQSEETLFQSRKSNFSPKSNLAVMAVCAESEEEANDLSLSMQYALFQIMHNNPEGIRSVKEIKSLSFSTAEQRALDRFKARIISGTPESVKKQLENLAVKHQVEELLILTVCYRLEDRIRSFELMSESFNLRGEDNFDRPKQVLYPSRSGKGGYGSSPYCSEIQSQ